jgi:antitoxin ParD1/3/4
MTELSITVPADLQRWLEARLAEGRYVDAGDYVRDLIRRDLEVAFGETEWLRGLVAEGLASGISDEKPETIIENIIAKRRTRRG